MSRQQDALKNRSLEAMRKISDLLKSGAIITHHVIQTNENENLFGLEIKIKYDEKVKTRAKILFPLEK
jgi:hypothetical protein